MSDDERDALIMRLFEKHVANSWQMYANERSMIGEIITDAVKETLAVVSEADNAR